MMLHVFTFQDIGSTESEAHHAEIEKLEERASALRKVLACKWSSKFSLCYYIPTEVGLLRWSYLICQNLFSYGGPDLFRQMFMFVILGVRVITSKFQNWSDSHFFSKFPQCHKNFDTFTQYHRNFGITLSAIESKNCPLGATTVRKLLWYS